MPQLNQYAWEKLLFLRDLGGSKVGGFWNSVLDDLLLIEDIRLVKQQCSFVSVKFDVGSPNRRKAGHKLSEMAASPVPPFGD